MREIVEEATEDGQREGAEELGRNEHIVVDIMRVLLVIPIWAH